MKNLTKAFVGTAAAAALAVSATPAMAKHGERNDKISAGEVIAGVAILGGIAAILASDNKRDRDYDYSHDRRYNRGYNGGYRNPARQATNQCIRAVEYGNRYNRAQVTDIRDIDRTRYGYKIKGRLAVSDGYRGRGRGYNSYDTGKFTCYVERGRVVDIDYRGVRGY